jgi:hypothetical protein
MAFVRTKKIGGKDYYYLVENQRVDGKIKQKNIASLGERSTNESAIEALQKEADEIEREFARFFRPYARVLAAAAALKDIEQSLPDFSDEEIIAVRRAATYMGKAVQIMQRLDKSFDRMMKDRRRGKKLRQKVELLRKYRSA